MSPSTSVDFLFSLKASLSSRRSSEFSQVPEHIYDDEAPEDLGILPSPQAVIERTAWNFSKFQSLYNDSPSSV